MILLRLVPASGRDGSLLSMAGEVTSGLWVLLLMILVSERGLFELEMRCLLV